MLLTITTPMISVLNPLQKPNPLLIPRNSETDPNHSARVGRRHRLIVHWDSIGNKHGRLKGSEKDDGWPVNFKRTKGL